MSENSLSIDDLKFKVNLELSKAAAVLNNLCEYHYNDESFAQEDMSVLFAIGDFIQNARQMIE